MRIEVDFVGYLVEIVDSAGELESCARLSRSAAVSPSVKLKYEQI